MLYGYELFVLLLHFSSYNAYVQRFEGDTCNVTNGVKHICTKIQDCLAAFVMIRNDERPEICGYDGFTAIVCCPQTGNLTSVTSTTNPPTESTVRTTTTRSTTVPISENNQNKPQHGFNSISEQKCDEYKKYVYSEIVETPLSIQFEDDDEPSSNVKKIKKIDRCAISEVPLVVDGTAAKPREFPHQVNIGYRYKDEIKWLCTGSLISENFVLSAAHCSLTTFGPPRVAVVGDLDISISTDAAKPQELKITQTINHPLYQAGHSYYDIALFRLEKNVTLDEYKRPACLNTKSDINERRATASGWGNIRSGGPSSSRLMKVRLDIIDKNTCDQYWVQGGSLKRGIDHNTMLCAGDLNGKKDTCQGDSGGPLQILLNEPYCMYSIIGVTSFGRSCGIKVPGVYTRVSYFIPWIESVVWPS